MAMRLSRSIVGEREAEAVRRVIVEDGYLGIGSEVQAFEKELAAFLGVSTENIATANSGTSALTLAVDAVAPKTFGRERGSVLIPSLTFVASFQATSAAGCRPIACEVLPETGTIDLKDAERRMRPDTFAIMPVHYASNPWHIEECYAFARKYGLRVIEDAAHAFGCEHHGKKIGSFGDLVCFSFDGIKNITSGEGGLVVAHDRESAEIFQDARLLSVSGDTKARFCGERSWDPDVDRQGWRFHMSNVLAAIGRVQLSRFEEEFAPARRKLSALYKESLGGLEHVRFLEEDPDDYIVPHIQVVRITDGLQPLVKQALLQKGIPVGTHYKPNHRLSYFADEAAAAFPQTETLFSELMTLPLHPGLSEEDIRFVCASLREALPSS